MKWLLARSIAIKRMSQGVGVALGGIILDTAMRNKSSGDRAGKGAYGVGATVGAVLPFSRSQEKPTTWSDYKLNWIRS